MSAQSTRIAPLSLLALLSSLVFAGGSPAPVTAQDGPMPPIFSQPATINHPYMPLSELRRVVLEGEEEGERVRTEITLLPYGHSLEWVGGFIDALVLQDMTFVEGQLVEVTYDYFAQADDGGVYYLGEDVTNYENGWVSDHEGTWRVGREGAQPALIMPAGPAVGMTYHPEELPGLVYETDVIKSLSEPALTPDGAISDGLLVEETLMDGTVEYKVYAPGFGVVEERGEDTLVRMTFAARVSPDQAFIEDDLALLRDLENRVMVSAAAGDFQAAANHVTTLKAVWVRVRPFITPDTGVQLAFAFETSLARQWAAVVAQSTGLAAEAQEALAVLTTITAALAP